MCSRWTNNDLKGIYMQRTCEAQSLLIRGATALLFHYGLKALKRATAVTAGRRWPVQT